MAVILMGVILSRFCKVYMQ